MGYHQIEDTFIGKLFIIGSFSDNFTFIFLNRSSVLKIGIEPSREKNPLSNKLNILTHMKKLK